MGVIVLYGGHVYFWVRALHCPIEQAAEAIIIVLLCYALRVWSGFSTVDLINKIESLSKKLLQYCYIAEPISFIELS